MVLILLDIDSLRPDHIGAFGYEQPTTPEIDELAQDAVIFTKAYTANSPCMPSRAALLTGRYGINNGVETHRSPGRSLNWPYTWEGIEENLEEWWTLPELMFNNRINATAVSSFPRHPSFWFYHIWNRFINPLEPNKSGEYFQTVRGETVSEHAIDLLNKNEHSESFFYFQFWDPHTPYNRSNEEIKEFHDSPVPKFPTDSQIKEHLSWNTWHGANHQNISNRGDLQEEIAHYDAEIRYVDAQVGKIVKKLKAMGVYEESTIILTADHGEEFGEHGLYREHWSTYDGTQRIPLLVKPPDSSNEEPVVCDKLVTNVDIAPTIADYSGVEAPDKWQGRSLKPLIDQEDTGWREYIVLDHGLYTAQRAVRTDKWKFIHTYHSGMWGGILDEHELYNLCEDPHEQTNIANERSDVVRRLNQMKLEWSEQYLGREEDPLHAVAREGPAGKEIYNKQMTDWEPI